MGFLLIGLGALAVWALTSGRSHGQPPAPQAPAPAAIVPPPAPTASSFVVRPEPTHDGGSIMPPADLGPMDAELTDLADIPAELLAVMQQGGSASAAELEAAIRTADGLGRYDLADYFGRRLGRRREYERAQREGTAPPDRRDVPIPTQSSQPQAMPAANADRAELSRLATRLADNLRRSAYRQYDRSLLIRFQTAAGLRADGKYGRQSANALGLYGHLPAGQVPDPQY